jgi:hypothetical protein
MVGRKNSTAIRNTEDINAVRRDDCP